jgi:hypothetical protein
MTSEEFPACARAHWASIRPALRAETDHPSPVRRTETPKRHGQGKRLVGMPTGLDRILQQARAQVLGPIFDPACSASSCGFRPGRSAHQAVKQIQGYSKRGAVGASRGPIGSPSLTRISGAGGPPAGSRSTSARSQNLRPGCVAAGAGVSGNRGARDGPKSGSCANWGLRGKQPSSRP